MPTMPIQVMLLIDENAESIIEKCEKENLHYRVRDLSQYPYDVMFVLELVVQKEPTQIVEEIEMLFGFTMKKNELRRGDVYRIITSVYDQLIKNYEDYEVEDRDEVWPPSHTGCR